MFLGGVLLACGLVEVPGAVVDVCIICREWWLLDKEYV
jgi:hypothetical protein